MKAETIQIASAEPLEAAVIASLFAESFRPEVAQLLIYACKGAAEHIRMQLAPGVINAESVYFVAKLHGGGIIGAAEFRRQPGTLFLNYIAVHPDHRGRRVATALLSAGSSVSEAPSDRFALDVLCDNAPARQWYSRLGLRASATSEFIELAPPSGKTEGHAYVSGLPQADLCQDRFGFSKFCLVSMKGTFSVGRIGDGWFRLTDLAAISDPAVFTTLKLLEPKRRIFGVVPASSTPPAQVVRLLARTHRMQTDVSQLMSSLSHDC